MNCGWDITTVEERDSGRGAISKYEISIMMMMMMMMVMMVMMMMMIMFPIFFQECCKLQ